jgi:hypothetical protein
MSKSRGKNPGLTQGCLTLFKRIPPWSKELCYLIGTFPAFLSRAGFRETAKQPYTRSAPHPPRPLLPQPMALGAKVGQAVSGGVLYWRILVWISGLAVGRSLRRRPG